MNKNIEIDENKPITMMCFDKNGEVLSSVNIAQILEEKSLKIKTELIKLAARRLSEEVISKYVK